MTAPELNRSHRDGTPVRVICTDRPETSFTVMTMDKDGTVYHHKADGTGTSPDRDLMPLVGGTAIPATPDPEPDYTTLPGAHYRWWRETKGEPTKPAHETRLAEQAAKYIREMMAAGFVCGQLLEEIEGLAYRGYWEVVGCTQLMARPIEAASLPEVRKTGIGITVAYCGHDAEIPHCDIVAVGNTLVVRANRAVTNENLSRPIKEATHHMSDHLGGFWRPDLGVFVVPAEAVTLIPNTDAT